MAEGAAQNTFDPAHLFGHVQDAEYFEVPRTPITPEGHASIPQPFAGLPKLWEGSGPVGAFDFHLTKFMVIELVVAVVMAFLFISLANKMRGGQPVKGRFWNFLESIVVFIRGQVAHPAIGHHDADRFMPYLLTAFFFILGCNLMGMLPWMGSPTGDISTTVVLALMTFFTVVGAGISKLGAAGYLKAQVPHMELPFLLAIFLKPMIFAIEILGLGIKHFVLSVRLFANIMAGHLVLAVILTFILAIFRNSDLLVLRYGVSIASVIGAVAISLLELFVSFLQAYIFTFLSALFIGMAVHPH